MAQITFSLRPVSPFRLDLTAWALRRRPHNLIDRWDGTTYRRVLAINGQPFELSVAQAGNSGGLLRVNVHSPRSDREATQLINHSVKNALGLRVDLWDFYNLAAQDGKLGPLADRFRGLKPPRFPSIFEGVVNGIACQQLSLSAGIHLLNRLAQTFGLSLRRGDSAVFAFPRPQDLAKQRPETIRKLGFNFHKARAIVELSRAIVEGKLDLESLWAMDDAGALERLMQLRGVGRWTAEYTLLRGMGRWHIFPVDDQGARNGLASWLRLRKPVDAARATNILSRWKPYGGLIYFHMLMRGLEEAGTLSSGGGRLAMVESANRNVRPK